MPPTKTTPRLASPSVPPPPSDSPLLVASLGATDAADEELTWFFEDALGAIELPTNHSASLRRRHHRVRAPDNREVDHSAEARNEALHAARIIYERLQKLSPEDLRVIRGLYTPADYPEWLEEAFGSLAPLVSAMRENWRELEGSPEEELLPLLAEAGGDAARALRAYEATRVGFRRSVVPAREEE
jgi:hypothetical protein